MRNGGNKNANRYRFSALSCNHRSFASLFYLYPALELMYKCIAINGCGDGALKDGIVVVIKSHWQSVRYEIVIK